MESKYRQLSLKTLLNMLMDIRVLLIYQQISHILAYKMYRCIELVCNLVRFGEDR